VLKKGGKAARDEKQQQESSGASSEDPYDFSTLEADIATAIERLKNDLSKLRAGGRFNPEVLENLRVQMDKGGSKSERLSDVAQVVPKGRVVQVLVGEKDVGLWKGHGCDGREANKDDMLIGYAACQTCVFGDPGQHAVLDTAAGSHWSEPTSVGRQHPPAHSRLSPGRGRGSRKSRRQG